MFYGLEQPIVTHLATACASVAFVAGVVDPAAIERNLQFVQEPGGPTDKHGAVFVCAHPDYLGKIAETQDGACELNSQRWVLAVCTRDRNIETASDGLATPARVTNGPLVVEVMAAMKALRWTAVGDRREGMRTVRRVNTGSLPGVTVYAADGVYVTLLCYEADLTGASSDVPGTTYPTITIPQVSALIDQAIANHDAQPDPHPQYTTDAEALAIAQAAIAAAGGGPTGPRMTYASGRLDRIDYDDGSYKQLSYDAGNGYRLQRIDYVRGTATTRKDFFYNPDGTLHEIVQTEL